MLFLAGLSGENMLEVERFPTNNWKRGVIPHLARLPQMPPLVRGDPGEGKMQIESEKSRFWCGHLDVLHVQAAGLFQL
jgi:hypothetical protein